MKKTKQILAMGIVIFLVVLYAATLIFAILDYSWAFTMFKACLAATFILPITLYIYLWIYNVLNKKDE